jgi:DNA modification methylase
MGGKARNCQLEDGLRYSHTLDNIGNLKHGEVDAVITSPPYAEVVHSTGQTREKVIEMLRKKGYSEAWIQAHYMGPYCQVKETGYSENPENIGNLPIDAVITSPPYSEGTGHGRGKSTELQTTKKLYLHGVGSYSKSRKNIGEISGHETYLEAMLKVYSEMWKVLKLEGLAIIVIKPFIRNKKVVDLPWHTWLLLEKVGFKLTKLYKLHLKQDSFWRVLYIKKYPDVPQIKHEYVIVCQKSPSFYG